MRKSIKLAHAKKQKLLKAKAKRRARRESVKNMLRGVGVKKQNNSAVRYPINSYHPRIWANNKRAKACRIHWGLENGY